MADGEFSFGDFSASLDLGNVGQPEWMPVTPAGGGGGGGFGDFARLISGGVPDFGSFAKGLLPLAQLGTAGLGVYTGIRGAEQMGRQTRLAEGASRTQKEIAGAARSTAAPLSAFSAEKLARAQRGEIPAPIQAQIDQWRQGARQQAQDYAARSGQGDSSQLQSWLAWIDQQAQAMQAAALESEMGLGVSAGGAAGAILGQASGAAGGAGQTATGQVASIEQLIAEANRQLGRLSGGAA